MPVTYRIDRPNQLILTRCTGAVVLDEVRQHFVALSQDPECPERLDVLLDLSEMTTLPASDQLRTVTTDIARLQPEIQFGICASSRPARRSSAWPVCSWCSRNSTSPQRECSGPKWRA